MSQVAGYRSRMRIAPSKLRMHPTLSEATLASPPACITAWCYSAPNQIWPVGLSLVMPQIGKIHGTDRCLSEIVCLPFVVIWTCANSTVRQKWLQARYSSMCRRIDESIRLWYSLLLKSCRKINNPSAYRSFFIMWKDEGQDLLTADCS